MESWLASTIWGVPCEIEKQKREVNYVMKLMPSPASVVMRPYNLCASRARFSSSIPQLKDGYMLQTHPSKAGKALKQMDPKTRKLEPITPVALGTLDVARSVYRTRGPLGLFEGFFRNHVINLIENELTEDFTCLISMLPRKGAARTSITPATEGLLQSSSSDSSSNEMQAPVTEGMSWWQKIQLRSRHPALRFRFACRDVFDKPYTQEAIARACGSLAASALIYPLRTVSLRCDVYCPFDQKRLGFIDMTKCTLSMDGFTAFYAGFSRYAISRLADEVASVSQEVASQHEPKDQHRVKLIVGGISTLSMMLTSFLIGSSEELQVTSSIPGLVPKEKTPAMGDSSSWLATAYLLMRLMAGVHCKRISTALSRSSRVRYNSVKGSLDPSAEIS